MTKAQKSIFKTLKKNSHRKGFLDMLMSQQDILGKYEGWKPAYAKKCAKKGAKPPFDMIP